MPRGFPGSSCLWPASGSLTVKVGSDSGVVLNRKACRFQAGCKTPMVVPRRSPGVAGMPSVEWGTHQPCALILDTQSAALPHPDPPPFLVLYAVLSKILFGEKESNAKQKVKK